MKEIYYGYISVKKSILDIGKVADLSYVNYIYSPVQIKKVKETLLKYIKELESGKMPSHFKKHYYSKRYVALKENNGNILFDLGVFIEIDDKKGQIVEREYNLETQTMKYYLDIFLGEEEQKDKDTPLGLHNHSIEYLLKELKKLFENLTLKEEMLQPKKKKGFLSRLFK
ncbi:hypothetical protein P9294_gp074 [Bacillus phage FADO]|uniref:Uncharacterized protein n=1 Tax=Bacillus phage FADO TaxID=2917160 RepID=A0AAE9K5X2_9CAUD|nr:hypothetical protein P9294_gp074 [Bacillus phage FADO]UNY48789.1 hypothetical protein fado_74 [Bacillus phage FADO]